MSPVAALRLPLNDDLGAFVAKFSQYTCHAHHVVQNDHVGHQVVVLDHLALLVPDVLRNDPFSPKK
mgnify:CR=1 FL=1